jgi:hypothetical protein
MSWRSCYRSDSEPCCALSSGPRLTDIAQPVAGWRWNMAIHEVQLLLLGNKGLEAVDDDLVVI